MPKQRKKPIRGRPILPVEDLPARTGFLRRWPIQQDQCRQAFPRYHRTGRSFRRCSISWTSRRQSNWGWPNQGLLSLYPVRFPSSMD